MDATSLDLLGLFILADAALEGDIQPYIGPQASGFKAPELGRYHYVDEHLPQRPSTSSTFQTWQASCIAALLKWGTLLARDDAVGVAGTAIHTSAHEYLSSRPQHAQMDQSRIVRVWALPDVDYAYEKLSLVKDEASGGFKIHLKWLPSLVPLHSFVDDETLDHIEQNFPEVLGYEVLEAIANVPSIPQMLPQKHCTRLKSFTHNSRQIKAYCFSSRGRTRWSRLIAWTSPCTSM